MLPTLLRIAASNALSAVVLAVVVAGVSRLCARPALTRALWVLVLLKLLMPPLWTIPVDDFFGHQPTSTDGVRTLTVRDDGLARTGDVAGVGQASSAGAADNNKPESGLDSRVEPPTAMPAASRSPIPRLIPPAEWIAAAWIAGTLGGLIALVARVRQFLRSLRHAARAPARVQGRCSALAAQLGLRQSPGVWFVRTSFCPSLWAFSRPARVLVPQQLWDRLEPAQQDALLVHELAHLRRRDHWVRLLEVAATLVYWWHPVVWYGRRRLHEAEEQCCDAWVLGILPSVGNSYAAALLDTVDFISSAHPATPALASGLGEFSHLKRRIIMIQNGSVRKALTWTGAMIVFGLAGIVLPVAPGFGQDNSAKEKPKPELKEIEIDVDADKARAGKAEATQGEAARTEAERSIMHAKLEIQQLSAEMQRIQATLAQAKARLRALEVARSNEAGTSNRFFVSDTTNSNNDRPANVYTQLGNKFDNQPQTEKHDPRSRADRLDQLEREVKRILGEIHEMKGDQSGQPKQ